MSAWGSRKARVVLKALLKIGWQVGATHGFSPHPFSHGMEQLYVGVS